MLNKAHAEFQGPASSFASAPLFMTDGNFSKHKEAWETKFLHVVAKSLFSCKSATPNLQLIVVFLCTLDTNRTEDDWNKLCSMKQHLRYTCSLGLTPEAPDTHALKWWIGAALSLHADMKSQAEESLSTAKGKAYRAPTREKLNTCSFTEAELFNIKDFMLEVLKAR